MTQTSPRSSNKEYQRNKHKHQTPKRPTSQGKTTSAASLEDTAKRAVLEAIDTVKTPNVSTSHIDEVDTTKLASVPIPTPPTSSILSNHTLLANGASETIPIEDIATIKTPSAAQKLPLAAGIVAETASFKMNRVVALGLILLLAILVLQSAPLSENGFLGAQGWANTIGGPASSRTDLLKGIVHPTKPGVKGTPVSPSPQKYINTVISRMTLEQKIGQMMIVQFVGPSYSPDLDTMISRYGVGAVLIFAANQNIQDKVQLRTLIAQMQHNGTIPLAIAIDQEGGVVDRLVSLDGPRPSAATIGATNDPSRATAEGLQDAQDLASYGINLNLAPVVDVTNVYNPQLDTRTFGNNPDLVTKMAAAYLAGLQKSGKVLGTLKHFPGLGDVSVDPHVGVPMLNRSLPELENIDWAPYRTLIQQGNVHAIMVTHELVTSVDGTMPSSLSKKVVTGILRQQLGFQGVIMTDSLTMEGILAYATESQAAAMAVEAGSDLLMGASTPSDVASMVEGIKQAVNNGAISQQQIDDSVRRILTLKYTLGLLPISSN